MALLHDVVNLHVHVQYNVACICMCSHAGERHMNGWYSLPIIIGNNLMAGAHALLYL